MKFNSALRNLLIVLFGALVLSACSTAKKSDLSGDVYTGKETIEYLAKGVPDRVCLLYTSPSPRDRTRSRMPSSA